MEKICKLDIKIDVLAPMVLTSKSNNTVLTTSADFHHSWYLGRYVYSQV